MNINRRKIPIIALIITVFIAKELAWVCFTPSFRGPDEILHYRYIQTLFYEQRLPILGQTIFSGAIDWTGVKAGKVDDSITMDGPLQPKAGYQVNWIAHHPPLYYFALLPVYSLLQNQNVIFAMLILRTISVLIAAATLYFIFRTMEKLLPQNRIMQTVITCAVAFLPTFSYINALINNGNLMDLLSAILIYLLVVRNEPQGSVIKWSIKTGIVLALLALTKMTSLPLFIPVLIIVRTVDFFGTKEPAKRRYVVYSTIIVLAIPLAVAGWWYIRNYVLFGAFFATVKDAAEANPQIVKAFPSLIIPFPEIDPSATVKVGLYDFFITKNFFVKYYISIWGSYGYLTLTAVWEYVGVFAFTAIGVMGQIKNMYLKKIFKGNPLKRLRDFLASGQGILFLTAVILMIILTWQLYEISSLGGFPWAIQGRYFLAAAPALFYMLLRGWEHLIGKKWFEKAAIALIVLFVINDAISLIYDCVPFCKLI